MDVAIDSYAEWTYVHTYQTNASFGVLNHFRPWSIRCCRTIHILLRLTWQYISTNYMINIPNKKKCVPRFSWLKQLVSNDFRVWRCNWAVEDASFLRTNLIECKISLCMCAYQMFRWSTIRRKTMNASFRLRPPVNRRAPISGLSV